MPPPPPPADPPSPLLLQEYFEYTPAVLRLMIADEATATELFARTHALHSSYVKNGDVIVASCSAVRRDHVLVGAGGGRAVPFDALILCPGSHYPSDIKSGGTGLSHRRVSLAAERARILAAERIVVVGGGVVGVELAADLAHFCPQKVGGY